jgi:hypothetical protein
LPIATTGDETVAPASLAQPDLGVFYPPLGSYNCNIFIHLKYLSVSKESRFPGG